MPLPEVWRLFTDLLYFTSRAFNLEIHAFILMDNHYHLLVHAPDANLPEAMRYFQCEVSRAFSRETGRINHLFGGRYRASQITSWQHHHAVYKYLYRNSVDAKICERVEQYPYSSLRGLLGYERSPLIIQDPLDFVDNAELLLQWLNYSFKKDQRECVRKALQRPTFEWKTGQSKINSWTEDLVFTTNAQGY